MDTPSACVFVNENASIVQSMARNGIGRPSKGVRDAILAKPPVAFAAILKENAEKAGYTYGDYLLSLAAKALDMPEHAPQPARDRASEIDFTTKGVDSAAA